MGLLPISTSWAIGQMVAPVCGFCKKQHWKIDVLQGQSLGIGTRMDAQGSALPAFSAQAEGEKPIEGQEGVGSSPDNINKELAQAPNEEDSDQDLVQSTSTEMEASANNLLGKVYKGSRIKGLRRSWFFYGSKIW